MKIKQVEELVGITSKNIRFYEDQGLLTPERADNGYREYHQSDVVVLKQIKLLRKLGISVEEIHRVLEHHISLHDCLEKRMEGLQKERDNTEKLYAYAGAMVSREITIDSLDCDLWLDEMENMEKEGIDFVDVSKVDIHMKKKAGALAGGVVMIVLMCLFIGLVIWGMSTDPEMPLLAGILFIGIPAIIVIAIIVSIRNRVKEIDGGEEDEAAKY